MRGSRSGLMVKNMFNKMLCFDKHMSVKINEWHLSKNIPIFLKIQAVLESSDNHTIEEMKAIEDELKSYSKQIDEMRERIHAIAHEKWKNEMLKDA